MRKEDADAIKKGIDHARIISFDLYDTLIFRKFEKPEDVFRFMGFLTGTDHFTEIRKRMQRNAYRYVKKKLGNPHPVLHEIYQAGHHHIGLRRNPWAGCNCVRCQTHQNAGAHPCAKNKKRNTCMHAGGKRFEIRPEWEDLERELERNAAVPNRAMKEIYLYAEQAGKTIVICTDMYLPGSDIRRILHQCGYEGFHRLYLSSEIKKTKYQGDMFSYMLRQEAADPKEVFHIGDSLYSDVRMPRRFGIQTFHYRQTKGDYLDSLRRFTHTERSALQPAEAFWYGIGYHIGGPFYMGLCAWLEKEARGRRIFCLSRDGFNLAQILNKSAPGRCEYVRVSRRALILPSIGTLGARELELLPPYSCGQTVQEVLRYLHLEGIPEQAFTARGLSGYGAVIRTKSDIAKVKRVYLDHADVILRQCQAERSGLESYFQALGLFDGDVLFFDSGWNGTSQYLMERIYRLLGKDNTIRFLYAGLKDNAKKIQWLRKSRYRAFLNARMEPGRRTAVLDCAAVLELFFSEDAPALLCYSAKGLQFEPHRSHAHAAGINEGIQDYLEQNQDMAGTAWAGGLEDYALARLEDLVLHPAPLQAEKIGDIENADSMSACRGMKKYIARIPLRSLKENPFLDIFWEPGVYRHPANSFGVKLFVWVRQRIAHWIGSR